MPIFVRSQELSRVENLWIKEVHIYLTDKKIVATLVYIKYERSLNLS